MSSRLRAESKLRDADLAVVRSDIARELVVAEAVRLLAVLAILAGATGVDEGAHADILADLELGDVLPNAANDAGDLVANDHGEWDFAPVLVLL